MGIAAGVMKGHFGCVFVVLANEQHRQLPDTGKIEAFVESTVVDGSVAKERHGHMRLLCQFKGVCAAGCLQNARAHNAAGAHQADFGREQMHAAASSPRTAVHAAEQLGDQFERLDSFGQRVSVAAMRAEDDVVPGQMRAHAGRDRFFTHVSVACSMDQSMTVRFRQLQLRPADR